MNLMSFLNVGSTIPICFLVFHFAASTHSNNNNNNIYILLRYCNACCLSFRSVSLALSTEVMYRTLRSNFSCAFCSSLCTRPTGFCLLSACLALLRRFFWWPYRISCLIFFNPVLVGGNAILCFRLTLLGDASVVMLGLVSLLDGRAFKRLSREFFASLIEAMLMWFKGECGQVKAVMWCGKVDWAGVM